MELKALPIGIDNFEMLISREYYYVDKTLLIKDILDNKASVNLFTRPRRFGKTLNMSMLQYFFEKREEDNFENLLIEFKDEIFAYYFNIPFEETLNRHKHKSNAHEFGKTEMRRWWNEKDFLRIITERCIYKDLSLEEIVDIVYNDVKSE